MKKLLHLKDLEKSFGRQMVLDHVGLVYSLEKSLV